MPVCQLIQEHVHGQIPLYSGKTAWLRVAGEIKVSGAQLMLHRWQQALQDASACNSASEAKGGKAAADGLSYVLQQAAR